MNILIADKFEKEGIEGLKKLGCEVTVNPELLEMIAGMTARQLAVKREVIV